MGLESNGLGLVLGKVVEFERCSFRISTTATPHSRHATKVWLSHHGGHKSIVPLESELSDEYE